MNYYKTRQAAKMLGISKQTLVRWEREKKVPLAKRDYLNHRAYTEKDIIKIREIIGLGILRDPFTTPQKRVFLPNPRKSKKAGLPCL